MSRAATLPYSGDLPTPRDYAGIHVVHAVCTRCDHLAELDLPALVAGGLGDVPLISLRLRCGKCGVTKHRIIVSGQSYGLGDGSAA
jgi:hypothetical protein